MVLAFLIIELIKSVSFKFVLNLVLAISSFVSIKSLRLVLENNVEFESHHFAQHRSSGRHDVKA